MTTPDKTNTKNVCENFGKLNENERYRILGMMEGMVLSREIRDKKDNSAKEEQKEKSENKEVNKE